MKNALPIVGSDDQALSPCIPVRPRSTCGDSITTASADLVAARTRLIAAAEYRKRQILAAGDDEYYGSRDEPEEEVDSVPNSRQIDAIVTRNHYGCLVLNAAHALFIDVDVSTPAPLIRNQKHDQNVPSAWRSVLDDLRIVLAGEANQGFRIYRTAGGFRILATTHEFEPGSTQSTRLMNAIGADAAFVDLCRIQNSFRARLTPKPWRCGSRRPPNSFPRHTSLEFSRFKKWLTNYDAACRQHATCRYIGHVGAMQMHERIASIIDFHDRQTKAHEPLRLA
jgi:hypothetical protein